MIDLIKKLFLMEAKQGDFKLKIGGRIQNDWTIYDTDKTIRNGLNLGRSIGDGTEFRRVRLYMEGEIYDNITFKTQFDFVGLGSVFRDVYLELKNIPTFGNFRVGHFKEPFSLEELTSSKYATFMERGLANVFAPSRNPGFMIQRTAVDKRVTVAVGLFRGTFGDETNFGRSFGPDSRYNITNRITALPWYKDDGKKLLHVGFSHSHQFRDNSPVRYRSRPEAHLGPRFVDTGIFFTDDRSLLNPEVAFVYGPFSLQGEYTFVDVDSDAGDDPNFDSFYVYGSYFLTGENRVYKTSSGAFDRVKPKNNFGWGGGWGALETAFRYSNLHLSDGPIRGGTLSNFTTGLNWYLNPNVRFMLNYIHADQRSIDGQANIFQMRAQVDF